NGVKEGDRILRIGDKQAATLMSAEAAANLLKGDPDTTVELELGSIMDGKRVLKLKRQLVRMPSVSEPRFLDVRLGIGYLQLLGFHETTLEELNLAISKLQSDGMRTSILDLRGNPADMFDVARQVVELVVA